MPAWNSDRIGIWQARKRDGAARHSRRSRSSATARSGSAGARSVEQARPYVEAASDAAGHHRHPQRLAARSGRRRARPRQAHARLPGPLPARHRDRPPRGDERLHAPAEDDARVLRRPRRAEAGAEGRARRRRARPEDARPRRGALARHAPVLHRRRAHALRPRARSGRARWSRPRSRSSSSRTPRPPAGSPASTPSSYLGLQNYTSNLLKFGYTERDIADGGSDRLIDAVIPHGSAGADRRGGPRPPRGGRGPRLPPAARPRGRAAGGLRGIGEGAALTHAQSAERLLDQLRPVGGRGDLLEAEAQQQRVAPSTCRRRSSIGCRADLPVAAVRRAARAARPDRPGRSSRPRSRRPGSSCRRRRAAVSSTNAPTPPRRVGRRR